MEEEPSSFFRFSVLAYRLLLFRSVFWRAAMEESQAARYSALSRSLPLEKGDML